MGVLSIEPATAVVAYTSTLVVGFGAFAASGDSQQEHHTVHLANLLLTNRKKPSSRLRLGTEREVVE